MYEFKKHAFTSVGRQGELVEDKPEADKPALCMLAGSMPAQDKLAEDMPAQGELVEDKPEADKPALCMLAESMPAQDKLAEDMPAQGELVVDKLGEQCKRKLQQMEADSPAVIVIAYMCIIARLGEGCGSEWTRSGECIGLWKA
jgi:hypothetical protein